MLTPLIVKRMRGYERVLSFINRLKALGYDYQYWREKDGQWAIYYHHWNKRINIPLAEGDIK